MAFPTSPSNGDIYKNYKYNLTTGAWNKLDGIVESGSDYIKFRDGTLICYNTDNSNTTVTQGPSGPVYYKQIAKVFPVEFLPGTIPTVSPMGFDNGSGISWATISGMPTNTGFNMELCAGSDNVPARPAYSAIGKWK